jgi:hypothetical protein
MLPGGILLNEYELCAVVSRYSIDTRRKKSINFDSIINEFILEYILS